jgi:RecA-family ATPase
MNTICWGINLHYPYKVQKCTILANLKSNQEALASLNKLKAMDEIRKAHKKNSFEKNKETFERGKTNRQGA